MYVVPMERAWTYCSNHTKDSRSPKNHLLVFRESSTMWPLICAGGHLHIIKYSSTLLKR